MTRPLRVIVDQEVIVMNRGIRTLLIFRTIRCSLVLYSEPLLFCEGVTPLQKIPSTYSKTHRVLQLKTCSIHHFFFYSMFDSLQKQIGVTFGTPFVHFDIPSNRETKAIFLNYLMPTQFSEKNSSGTI